MIHYTQRLWAICMALLLLTACDKHDTLPDNPPTDPEDQGQHPTPTPAEDLKLTLDLYADLRHDNPMLAFAEEETAVALIRNTDKEEIIYLPLVMRRTEEQLRQAGLQQLEVDLKGMKADSTRTWQLKLIIGGRWNADTRQIQFNAPSDTTPSKEQTTVTLHQPYVSTWQSIPTNEKGQFAVSENGRTQLAVQVTAPARILSHHIVSCQADTQVEISTLQIRSEALSFGGSYDLSDTKALQEMDDEAGLQWTAPADTPHCIDLHFSTPILLRNNEQPSSEDFLYLWGMPTESKETTVSVTASGQLLKQEKEPFDSLKIFEAALPSPTDGMTALRSAVKIESAPEVEGPITLSTRSEKTTIIADNTDQVEFVVMQGGKDVTRQSTIIRRENELFENPISGYTFKTPRKGSYEFYAVKEGERSNHIHITARPESETGPDGQLVNGTRFARNVDAQSGWYDVNKIGNGNSPQDGLLCWAAASSNLLQWWLDDLVKQGYQLPDEMPHGPGSRYRLAIFDTFFDCWTNYMHSTRPAIRWFLEGGGMTHSSSNSATPDKGGKVHEGGYFRGVLSADKEQELFQSDYVEEFGAYSGWILPSREEKKSMHKIFSELFMRLIDEGATALSIDSHELTAWGYDVEEGLVTRIYVTNSDDGGNPRLASYKVEKRGDDIHLIDYPGKTNQPTQIIRFTRMKAYSF